MSTSPGYLVLLGLAVGLSACWPATSGPDTAPPPIVGKGLIPAGPPATAPAVVTAGGVVDGSIRILVIEDELANGMADGFRRYWDDINGTQGGIGPLGIELVDDPAGGVLAIGPTWEAAGAEPGGTRSLDDLVREYPESLIASPVRLGAFSELLVVAPPTRPSVEDQAALALELAGSGAVLLRAEGPFGDACVESGDWAPVPAAGGEFGIDFAAVLCVASYPQVWPAGREYSELVVALESAHQLGEGLPAGMVRIGGCPDPDSPGMALFESIVGPDASPAMLEGYLQAATLHLVLARAVEAGDLTPGGLRAALADPEPVDLGFGTEPAALAGSGPSAIVCEP